MTVYFSIKKFRFSFKFIRIYCFRVIWFSRFTTKIIFCWYLWLWFVIIFFIGVSLITLLRNWNNIAILLIHFLIRNDLSFVLLVNRTSSIVNLRIAWITETICLSITTLTAFDCSWSLLTFLALDEKWLHIWLSIKFEF